MMRMVEITWIFNICLTSTYAIAAPLLNLPMNGRKSDELSFSKVGPRSITKLSFSNLPKLPDLIDEEDNFWINPRREQKRHYESLKIGQPSKNLEGGSNLIDNMNKNQPSIINSQMNSNLEGLPTWIGFPKSFSKMGPKTGRTAERTVNPNSESIPVSKASLSITKSSSNFKIQQGIAADKNTSSEKDANTEKAADKTDFDISDFLILNAFTDKVDDFSVEKIKEEIEKQTTPPTTNQPRGFLTPYKKNIVFNPIFSSIFDILRSPYQRSGFSFHNLGHRHNFKTNRVKDLEIEQNEIKINPKEHLTLGDKGPFLIFNNLKKLPIQLSPQIHGNLFKSEGSIQVRNFPALTNFSEPGYTMTEISLSPAQGHIEDLGTFFGSLKLNGQDNELKKMKLNFRSLKPLSKKEISSAKSESSSHQNNHLDQNSKQTHGLNSISMKGNMFIDMILESAANQFPKEKKEIKDKKEGEKISKLDFKEFCKKNMDKYPKLYEFLEKFSDKIVETALRYEISSRYSNILEASYRIETPKLNNSSNISQL